MSEPSDGSAQERALWQRWNAAAASGAAPDALTLAEFAEDRLSGAAKAAVEAFLAVNPEVADDVAAARLAPSDGALPEDGALAATIARAAALVAVPADGQGGDTIVPFRRRAATHSPWPSAARWSALAASLVFASWLGFALGTDAYGNLAALDGQSSPRLVDELLDPPSGFFGLVDPSGT